ncbi:MAG: aminotransferase class I/II-fold pyridoxal phosphate-dependent enzyme [Clostridiaceae bacterium]
MLYKNWNTPVYSAIKAYTDTAPLPFHMPGHKLGKGIPEEFLGEIEKLDLTEIPGMDNLHAPAGAVKEAQELAAAAFGARKSFFLVNGSTVGLHAAIAAMCRPGQSLIVGRDCHSSVINGMLLAGVRPHYILPEYTAEFGINTGVAVSAVEKALDDAPDAAGVLLTRPNYYGVCSDVTAIAKLVHAHGKLLAVDEAHGSHLYFNKRLPAGSLESGADICVQSAHKTLPAFTQGAILHVGSEKADLQRLQYFLDIFQTTSPSYIIMAYLDIARAVMQKYGKSLLDGLLDAIEACSGGMASKGIKILCKADLPDFEHDTTRITVNTAAMGISGYTAEKLLREQNNIQVEMSDVKNIVCISTIADEPESIARLFSAIAGLEKYGGRGKTAAIPSFAGLSLPADVMEPYEILNAQYEKIPLNDASGRVCRDIVSPYPPGIALVCPGERFNPERVGLLQKIIRCGGIVHGVDENGYVNVVK